MRHTKNTLTPNWGYGLAALLLTAVLYIPGMAAYSMWFDEINMVENALDLDMGAFYRIERQVYTSHPPLYFVLLKLWSLAAGESDLVLRALSVLPVLLTGAFVFRLGADFSGRAFGGLAAALVLGGMGFWQLYAHTTHNYTLLVLLVAGLLFFYARYTKPHEHESKHKRQPVALIGAVVFTILLLYTHYYGVYVVLAVNLHALVVLARRRDLWRWVVGQAVAGMAFLPWLPVVLRLAGGDVNKFGDQDALLVNSLPSNLRAIPLTFDSLLYDGWGGYLLLMLLGGVVLLWRRASWRVLGFILSISALSMALALLANLSLRSYLPRRVIFLVLPVALLIGCGLARLPRWAGWALLLGFLLLTPTYPLPPGWTGNTFFRQGIEAIDAQADDAALIYFSGNLETRPLNYYARQLLPIPYTLQLGDPAHFDNLMWARNRLWVLWADNAPFQLTAIMDQRGYTLQETQRIGWYNLSLYRATPPEKPTLPPTAGKTALPQDFGGKITLQDYGINTTDETLNLALLWSAAQPLHDDWIVYLHLLDANGALAAQIDERPRHAGRELPTFYWVADTPIYDSHTLPLPTASGVYTLMLGWYGSDGVRLMVGDADGLVLGQIRVE